MAHILSGSVRTYLQDENIQKRYVRIDEAVKIFGLEEELIISVAQEANAL